MKKKLIVFFAVAAVPLLLSIYLKDCYLRDDVDPREELFAEWGVRKIYLDGEARMLVHKEYVTEPAFKNGDTVDEFSVDLTWPELKAATREYHGETIKLVFMKGVSSAQAFNRLSMTETLSDFLEPYDAGIQRLRTEYFDEGRASEVYLSPDKTHYFVKYSEKRETSLRNWRDIHIECDAGGTGECRAFTELTSRIYGAYTFPSGMFPHEWEDVDKRVTYNVGRFVNDPEAMPYMTRAEASCGKKMHPLRTLRKLFSPD